MIESLILSREGIFPIAGGATGLAFSGTVQGEGKLCGTPSMFVRLQGCNLRCLWKDADGNLCQCDTAHTSFGDSRGGTSKMSVDDVFSTLKANMGRMRHVVITGGEPFIQADALASLVDLCRSQAWHVTVETNGTIFDRQVAMSTHLLSISPKLTSSIPTEAKLREAGLQSSAATRAHSSIIFDIEPLIRLINVSKLSGNDIQLKFVVSTMADEAEIFDRYINRIPNLTPSDIVVMPMGVSTQQIAVSSKAALSMAVRNGWRFSPRLHIDLFGNKEGV